MNITKQWIAACAAVGSVMVGGSAMAENAVSQFATGGDVVKRIGTPQGVDFVHIFSNRADVATFANTSGKPLTVRYLAVGGGGAGGTVKNDSKNFAGGGGGGGGAVIEDTATLGAADTWSVIVGKGGIAATGIRDAPTEGSATSISNGTTEIVLAMAGGNGSQYCKTYDKDKVYYPYCAKEGAAGGGAGGLLEATCSTGAVGRCCSRTLIVTPEGAPFRGGDSANFYTNATAKSGSKKLLAGGGGGAGGAGVTPADNKNNPGVTMSSGAGGVGLECDITGEALYYGAGGGGGGSKNTLFVLYATNNVILGGACGSTGVGGNGGTFDEDGTFIAPQAGLDGTGTGGGGAAMYSKCIGGNGGSGIVVIRYAAATWRTEDVPTALDQVGAQDAVTYYMSGEVEKEGDDIWIKPGTTATLYAVDAGGSLLVGWEDGETGELIRGTDIVQVTPATRRRYTAVFGKPWTYNSTTKKLTNGDWIFDVSNDKTVTNCTQAASDTVLNLATPMTDETGKAYKLSKLGSGVQKVASFIPKTLCETVRVFLPEGVRVNVYCFRGPWGNATARQSLSVPRNIKFGGGGVLYGCSSLTNLYFEGGEDGGQTIVKSGDYADFGNCTALRNIGPWPKDFTATGNSTFNNCTSLTSLNLPNITEIGYAAFCGCSALTEIKFGTNQVKFIERAYTEGSGPFRGVNKNCRIIFPDKAPVINHTTNVTCSSKTYQCTGNTGKEFFGGKSGMRLCGSWRNDPEGWKKIVDEIGTTGDYLGTAPSVDRTKGERRVNGQFYWAGKSDTTEPLYGWLIDMKMPGEPTPAGLILRLR